MAEAGHRLSKVVMGPPKEGRAVLLGLWLAAVAHIRQYARQGDWVGDLGLGARVVGAEGSRGVREGR